ncbi:MULTISPECIES: MerR family transcriptional regulator [unclassified Bifidobacterium]|uniref:MerR family transcriptional regulator n=1 Tax=unclassified Bifidobacterium TaxID=2608897 RepID=UPI0023F9D06C|nr:MULTISPECIES: MerR family transcriptional regulator [unclassified Bifidobacterium]WEV65004.1 MerR family transcriptional regulator [Bifidobacterium sp. ESL0764]WEV76175.1 MerR family transcriptional regulator [Bifidobacterium sp. ESL0800]
MDANDTAPSIQGVSSRFPSPGRFPETGHTTSAGLVQGELFSESNDETATRGYRGTVASKVAGITYRQLDYWARKQIVVPSITQSHGSGSRRLYSFKDVLILAVSKKLLDTGVNLQNVTAAIGFLSRHRTSQLEHMTIICDGQDVKECENGDEVLKLIDQGTAVFAVSVGKLWHQVEEQLEQEKYVDVTPADSTASSLPVSPVDDIAAERMRQKLETQRLERAERH